MGKKIYKESIADWLDLEKCGDILREQRWGEVGLGCVHCGSKNVKNIGVYKTCFFRYQCLECTKNNGCKTTFNDKSKTMFEHSKVSIQKWFYAISLVQKKVSANEISRELQVDGNTGRRMVLLIKSSTFIST